MGACYICISTLYAVMVHNDSRRERGQLARGGCGEEETVGGGAPSTTTTTNTTTTTTTTG